MYTLYTNIKKYYSILLSVVISLIVLGMIFIYSSSSIYSYEKFGYSFYYLKQQCFGLILGILLFFVAYYIPYKIIFKLTPLFFFASLFITILSCIPLCAVSIHGSYRWIKLGSFIFQPSELLKISYVLYSAWFLHKKDHSIFSLSHLYIPFFLYTFVTIGILLAQPDFGLTITLLITGCMLLYVANMPYKNLCLGIIAFIPLLLLLIITQPYRLKRIIAFLDPWQDPKGKGFQIIQSLVALGSGGLTGLGIGNSKQKFFYLPMHHTDFIFSIIGEEWGLLGTSSVIILFILFTYTGYKIASLLTNTFSKITTLGFIFIISLQACINCSVTLGLLPTKGIGLPFISFGSSSLICFVVMIGIIGNFIHHEESL